MVNVYAIQEVSGKNYLPAADYGEIKFLVPPKTNIMFSSEDTVNKIKLFQNSFETPFILAEDSFKFFEKTLKFCNNKDLLKL